MPSRPVFAAPGRVNLIGEHTDYAEGFVMPAAIDFATLAGISPRTDGKIVLYSENYARRARLRRGGAARQGEQALDRLSAGRAWSILAGEGHKIPGFSLTPVGRCAAGVGAFEFGRVGSGDGAGRDFAAGRQLSRARCLPGFASAPRTSLWAPIAASWTSSSRPMAQENHALLLDCRDLSFKLAPIPPHVALVIANTMVKHSVAGGDYTSRRARGGRGLRRHRPPSAGGAAFCAMRRSTT